MKAKKTMENKMQFTGKDAIDFDIKVPHGSSTVLGIIERPSFKLTIKKGYYGVGGVESAHINVELTNGSSTSSNIDVCTGTPDWKEKIMVEVERLVSLDAELCQLQMQMKRNHKAMEPFQKDNDVKQNIIFNLVHNKDRWMM